MALTLGVDSYVTLEEADLYHEGMGNVSWPQTPDPDENDVAGKKEAALRRATSFIDNLARGKWRGTKASKTQKLAWPRTDAYDEEGFEIDETVIPEPLKDAVCEAALKTFTGTDLMPDNRKANVASEAVSGAVRRSYFQNKSSLPVYNYICKLLEGLVTGNLSSSSGSIRARSGLKVY